jgi:hypothetical protein
MVWQKLAHAFSGFLLDDLIQQPSSKRSRVVSEKPNRSWQEIAAEAYQERDPERRQQLSEELERCLDERAKKISQPTPPRSNKQSA